MSEPLVVRNVEKRYGDFIAVGDLSFSVSAGSIFGILGPNGAGKTTTLRMINHILEPDSGTIRFFGDLPPGPQAAKRIGYLPEERGLYAKEKVRDVLEFFGRLRGLKARDAKSKAVLWLVKLGLTDWANHKVQDLSKGMQQKVQFATALIHEPELLILDEPWSGLDPINAQVLRDVVEEQKQMGRTILFSTHLMEHAEEICDHVCILAKGRKILDGNLAAIRSEANRGQVIRLDFVGTEREEKKFAELLPQGRWEVAERIKVAQGMHVTLQGDFDSQAFLALLVEQKFQLKHFEVVEPTLRQIFVERVGTDSSASVEGRQVQP